MDHFKKVLSRTRQAMQQYHMIDAGDTVAVGVSSGKDSLTLLLALSRLRRFYPVPFSLLAVTLDMGIKGEEHGDVAAFCREEDVPYHVIPTDIYKIVFEERHEKNPCALCSRIRRRLLCDAAAALGAGKLALGHHMDDAAETAMMNLIFGGEWRCFEPMTTYEDSGITLIRPLILTPEKEIRATAKDCNLPVKKSLCPEDHNTERENIKALLRDLEYQYPGVKHRILGALKKSDAANWQPPIEKEKP